MQDMRKKSISELVAEVKKVQKELHSLRMKHKTSGVKETHRFKQLRKTLARTKTVLSSLRANDK